MTCPYCKTTMGCDAPLFDYELYVCEECGHSKEYHRGHLVFESQPDKPMKPPVRIG